MCATPPSEVRASNRDTTANDSMTKAKLIRSHRCIDTSLFSITRYLSIMTIKNSLQNSLLHDLTVCQHLYTKFEAKSADWRPQANMRSTVELMQYLCYIGKTMTGHFVNPAEDKALAIDNYRAKAKWSTENVTFANFAEMIEREKEGIRETLANVSDADLMRMTYHPFSKEETTFFDALLTVVKYLCAYRQQLFLYAKMSGAEINTGNNWRGVDSQPAAAKPAVAATA